MAMYVSSAGGLRNHSNHNRLQYFGGRPNAGVQAGAARKIRVPLGFSFCDFLFFSKEGPSMKGKRSERT